MSVCSYITNNMAHQHCIGHHFTVSTCDGGHSDISTFLVTAYYPSCRPLINAHNIYSYTAKRCSEGYSYSSSSCLLTSPRCRFLALLGDSHAGGTWGGSYKSNRISCTYDTREHHADALTVQAKQQHRIYTVVSPPWN